jgi:hypothetical protein
MTGAKNRDNERLGLTRAGSRDALRHGAIPDLLAFDEAKERRIVAVDFPGVADGAIMAAVNWEQKIKVRCAGLGAAGRVTPSRFAAGTASNPFAFTVRVNSRSTFNATIGTRFMRAK